MNPVLEGRAGCGEEVRRPLGGVTSWSVGRGQGYVRTTASSMRACMRFPSRRRAIWRQTNSRPTGYFLLATLMNRRNGRYGRPRRPGHPRWINALLWAAGRSGRASAAYAQPAQVIVGQAGRVAAQKHAIDRDVDGAVVGPDEWRCVRPRTWPMCRVLSRGDHHRSATSPNSTAPAARIGVIGPGPGNASVLCTSVMVPSARS